MRVTNQLSVPRLAARILASRPLHVGRNATGDNRKFVVCQGHVRAELRPRFTGRKPTVQGSIRSVQDPLRRVVTGFQPGSVPQIDPESTVNSRTYSIDFAPLDPPAASVASRIHAAFIASCRLLCMWCR